MCMFTDQLRLLLLLMVMRRRCRIFAAAIIVLRVRICPDELLQMLHGYAGRQIGGAEQLLQLFSLLRLRLRRTILGRMQTVEMRRNGGRNCGRMMMEVAMMLMWWSANVVRRADEASWERMTQYVHGCG